MPYALLGLSRAETLQLKEDTEEIIRTKDIGDIFKESFETGKRAFMDKLKDQVYNTVVGDYVKQEETKAKQKIASDIISQYLPLFIIAVLLIFIFLKKGI